MSELTLKLVIKAPSQKQDDFIVNCNLDWTVEQLKDYLSEKYPGQPRKSDQKLIYAGKLLSNSEIWKDIVKHSYDKNSTTFAVHLLCLPRSEPAFKPSHSSPASKPQVSNSSPSVSVSESDAAASASSNADGLRHRHVAPSSSSQQNVTDHVDYSQYFWQNQTPQNPAVATSFPATMPAMLPGAPFSPEQMLWYQQMYAQQMAQYMQYMQGNVPNNLGAAVTSSTEHLAAQQNAMMPAAAVPNAPAAAAPAQNQPMVMNAAGGQAMDDEDELDRDWLDIVYIATRLSLMITIVYFYSTFTRFFMVAVSSLLIYLYQGGYLRLRGNRQHRRNNREAAPAQQQQHQPQQENADAPAQAPAGNNGDEADVSASNSSETTSTEEEEPQEEERNPSNIVLVFRFLITFFTSLIPAPPEPIAIN